MAQSNMIGRPVYEADTPALLLDLDILQSNIDTMAAFFEGRPCGLRPHFKSHKCTAVAKMQMDAGAVGITCAKLGEAEALVDAGLPDILIANQIVGAKKMQRLMNAAKRCKRLMVAVDSPANIKELSDAATAAGVTLGVLVEVNIGMNRCGVEPGQPTLELARMVANTPGLIFEGLQGYEGHLVLMQDGVEREAKTKEALAVLVETRKLVEDAGIPVGIVSGGGTGTYSVTGAFSGIDEVQAGSYAAMDWYYSDIRPEFKQAMSLLVTIISRPKPGVAIGDVGTKGVGAEFGSPKVKGIEGASVAKFGSEEHCALSLPDNGGNIGDKIELIPSHGCTTSNLYREFIVHQAGKVVGVWPIEGAGKLK